jgi:hypothetical protein
VTHTCVLNMGLYLILCCLRLNFFLRNAGDPCCDPRCNGDSQIFMDDRRLICSGILVLYFMATRGGAPHRACGCLISRSPFFIWSDYFTFHFSSIFIMLARHYHDKCARIRCFCRNEKRARVPGNCKRCAASYSSAPTTASPLAETGIQVLQRHWPGIKFEFFFFKYYSSTQSYFAVKFNTRPMDF